MPDYKAILSGQSWNSPSSLKDSRKPVFLTYTFNPSSFLAPFGWSKFKSADKEIARKALKIWGDASGIRFIEVKGQAAELKLQWALNWQTIVAWAEFPELDRSLSSDGEGVFRDYDGGNVYLNTEHRSELGQNDSYKLYVLLHEIGHALGLKHPFHKMDHNKQLLPSDLDNVQHTVMSYTGGDPDMGQVGLGPLDVQAIRALYGDPSQDGRQVAKWSWSNSKQTLTQIGKSKADVIYGVAVKDIVKGGSGNDKLYGFDGDDVLYGDTGNDFLSGSDGDDILRGGTGHDVLRGGFGDDTLQGGTGRDTLSGGYDDDTLYGDADDDVLQGGDGNDILQGGTGHDNLDGGDDDDALYGGLDDDVLHGGGGEDTLQGDSGNDVLDGDSGDDSLQGAEGSDSLSGGIGWDILQGGDGKDDLNGGSGNDTLQGGTGSDTLTGSFGSDQFVFDTAFNGVDDVDQIVDFNSWEMDKIVLSSAIFSTLLKGALSSGAFVRGATANDADDRILFDLESRSLSYDPDGSGSSAAVRFAKLLNSQTIDFSDFIVV